MQPIIVRPAGAGLYRVLAGHKRFMACRKLGWRYVPVVIQREPEPGGGLTVEPTAL